MKVIKYQRGMGMLQLALVLAIAGFFLIFAFKVVPLYAENRYVESALRSFGSDGVALGDMSNEQIKAKLGKFYIVNNVRSDGPTNNIVIDRSNDKVLVTIDYETRVTLFANIDLVAVFKNHLDSTRPNECCKPVVRVK